MIYIVVGTILVVDLAVLKMASRCSRVEEIMEFEMNGEKKI